MIIKLMLTRFSVCATCRVHESQIQMLTSIHYYNIMLHIQNLMGEISGVKINVHANHDQLLLSDQHHCIHAKLHTI